MPAMATVGHVSDYLRPVWREPVFRDTAGAALKG
jgi:hypothetical protein